MISGQIVTFSSVYAFIHDRLKMVYRDTIMQSSDAYSICFLFS